VIEKLKVYSKIAVSIGLFQWNFVSDEIDDVKRRT